MMTDLEMTKLCAEAMGHSLYLVAGRWQWEGGTRYDPLTNDAQAMALVKKFELDIRRMESQLTAQRSWQASESIPLPRRYGQHVDLNRAIVECAAKMQAAMPKPQDGEA